MGLTVSSLGLCREQNKKSDFKKKDKNQIKIETIKKDVFSIYFRV